MPGPFWTDDDRNALRQIWPDPTWSNDDVTWKLPGRSWASLTAQASRMHLGRRACGGCGTLVSPTRSQWPVEHPEQPHILRLTDRMREARELAGEGGHDLRDIALTCRLTSLEYAALRAEFAGK